MQSYTFTSGSSVFVLNARPAAYVLPFLLLMLTSTPHDAFAPVISPAATTRAIDTPFNLQWKMPVGSAQFATVSQNGQELLLSVLFDGYYLYNATGSLIWHLPDSSARFAEFSADGNSILLARDLGAVRSLSVVETGSMHEKWNYTTYYVPYARLSPVRNRAAFIATFQVGTRFQQNLVVKDAGGNDLLNLTLAVGEFGYPSCPAINLDGRYVAVGSWGTEGQRGWLYFKDFDSGKSWNVTVQDGVQFVAMSANASSVVAAGQERLYSFDKTGRLSWSTQLPDLFGYLEPFADLAVSADGEYIAVSGGGVKHAQGYVSLFNKHGRKLWEHLVPSAVTAFAMDNSASKIVVGDWDGGVYALNRTGTVQSMRSLASNVESVSVSGSQGLVIAVGAENIMYVMNAHGDILWSHREIGWQSRVAISQDGKRILVHYVGGTVVLNENGQKMMGVTTNSMPTSAAIFSDGNMLALAWTAGRDYREGSVLTWYAVNTGTILGNVSLGLGSTVDSLRVSGNGGLSVVSGAVPNFTFIEAFDSQGRKLWEFLTPTREVDPSYHDSAWVESAVAVSEDGRYVAAARREVATYKGGHCCAAGSNNGVVLFDQHGAVIWNYTTQDWVWSSAISGDGQYIAAAGSSEIYLLDRSGRLMWSLPALSAVVALSKSGGRLVAGHYNGGLFLGNNNGTYWQMGVDGHVESVDVSDNGNLSAALISRDYPNAVSLIYILDNNGKLLGNFTYPLQSTGSDSVAVSGNGCCVVASMETSGIYYFTRNVSHTQTVTSQTVTGPAGSVAIRAFIPLISVAVFVGVAVVVARIVRRRGRLHAISNPR